MTTNIFDMADTWNAGATTFTAIKMNVTDTASAAGSLLIDLQVATASKFRVRKDGLVTFSDLLADAALTLYGTTDLYLGSGGGAKWHITAANGDLVGVLDNTYNIGTVGANRPANIYVGTLIQTPALRVDQTPTAVGTGAKTISNAADSSTNLGHYASFNMNGTTYYFPCGSVALT